MLEPDCFLRYALQRGILLYRENPTYAYWRGRSLLRGVVLKWFLSRVSTLTRDIDIAILSVRLSVYPCVCLSVRLSVRLSVTFRYQMKTV